MIKRKNPLIKFVKFLFQTDRIKNIYHVYEDIIINPVLITAFIFVFILFFVTGVTVYYGFYDIGFLRDLMVEAHGVVFDIFMLGVVIFWLQQKGKNKVEKRRYQDEIDDFRGWNSEEASRRIRGNLRRLNSFGVSSIDISNCFLRNMDLRNTNLSGCYAWGADLSWADLRFSKLSKGNFEDANLSFSNLSGSDIKEAYFWKADLSNCNIRNSNMTNCVMIETDLSDTDFTESKLNNSSFANSNLKNSVFWGADLEKADFDMADLENSDFQNANLKDVIGLNDGQIKQIFSFYNSRISDELLLRIKKIKPSLLDPPEKMDSPDF
ncbi:MAG: pentapeptide repeat-containing protein [Desulfobacteraceae bacterium]|nr:pentapeptide repeat-containing protein [Desulfobacteraceae bacterium]